MRTVWPTSDYDERIPAAGSTDTEVDIPAGMGRSQGTAKKSVSPILAGDRDVLISAATAAGKTEAFFLPACSAIADIQGGFGILYISPLKALINDQYRRLENLGDALEMPVTPWHGDVAQSKKLKAKKNPAGILLITPESLEAMLIRNAGWLKQAFAPLAYIAIDEFHAFIGSERGMQLLSLLNRVDHLLGRINNPVPESHSAQRWGNWNRCRYLCGQINVCPVTLLPTVRLTPR